MFKIATIKTFIGSKIMNLKTILLTSLALMVFSPASAVMLSPDKQGQVLIFPYFGTLGGNTTLITVSTQNGPAQALKVHFRDRQGAAALSFNLYLEGNGSWVTALNQINGETHLELPDASCIFPALDDGSGSAVVPLTSGYLEVIEMGTIIDTDISNLVNEFDCDALNALWAENGQWNNDPSFGLVAPSGGLRGTASVVNVERGTLYSFVASALTGFSDIPQHSAPGELLPDLTTAHDAGTDNDATTSIVCQKQACIEDTWENPADAVAVSLLARQLTGDFSSETSVRASAEVVLAFPMRKFYFDVGHTGVQSNISFSFFVYDRTGAGDKTDNICTPIIDLPPCNAPFGHVIGRNSIGVLSFNNTVSDFGTTLASNILSEEYTSSYPSPQFPTIRESGQFNLFMFVGNDRFRSNSGRIYAGIPVIGAVLQEFSNGQLTNTAGQLVRANYGNAFELSRNQN